MASQSLNLRSTMIPQTIHQRAILSLRAQRATLQEKLPKHSVKLVWTLREDEQLWGKMLVKLSERFSKSLSNKG